MLKKLRSLPADYRSGLNPTLFINSTPAPDSIDFNMSAGIIREIYDQETNALRLSIDGGLVVNDETTPYTKITDLNQITTDTLGNSLTYNNAYYQIVVAISTNIDGKTRLLINKPTGSYTTAQEAFNDIDGYSVTTFPEEFETISLVAAFVIRYQTTAGGTYTNAASDFGVEFIDLRGQNPGAAAQGSGSAAITEFSDGTFMLFNSIDATKEGIFNLENITSGNTRTIFFPDRNLDLAEPIFDNVTVDGIIYQNGSSLDNTYLQLDGSNANSNIDLESYNLTTLGEINASNYRTTNNIGLSGNFSVGTCWMAYDSGLLYLTNCSIA